MAPPLAYSVLSATFAEQPGPVHHLPLATSLVALLFVASLSRRYRARGAAPHLAWWAAGVACYGLGTILEAAVTLALSVVLSPVDLSALEFHRPIGDILLWNRVRYATPLTNLSVVFFLVGGCRSFRGSPRGSNGG